MELKITFPGNKRVNAQLGSLEVATDQPAALGGNDSAPAPFDLFLASIGTCAGIYVLGFCQARNLSTEGLELVQQVEFDETTQLPTEIKLLLTLPKDFPEKYRPAILRTAEQCKVKKVLAHPPAIQVVLE